MPLHASGTKSGAGLYLIVASDGMNQGSLAMKLITIPYDPSKYGQTNIRPSLLAHRLEWFNNSSWLRRLFCHQSWWEFLSK